VDRRGQRQDQAREERRGQPAALERDHAPDDLPRLEGQDTRHGVGDERVHERCAVGVVGPLERGGDAVGQAEGTVGQPRRVSGGHAPGEPVRGAGERAQEHERGSEDERGEAEDGFEGEHGRGEEGTPECAAQAPVLGAAHSDLPRDPPDKDFDRLRMGHGSPPALSGERLLYRWP